MICLTMTQPLQQIDQILSRCHRVLVTTHVRPDGDALGSAAAMACALRHRGIEAEVLLLSTLPRKYAFIFDQNGIVHHEAENAWPEGFELNRFDALVVVDTGTWSQLPGMKDRIENWRGAKIVVDHHLTQEEWADVKLVRTEAAAAGEIVAELIDSWNVPINAGIASALYLALVSDTGWFQFSNTRPYTLRLAARLMEAGVDTDRMYQVLYQNERAERLALLTHAQDSLQLHHDGRLAVMCIRSRDFTETGAHVGDTENMINIPLQIATVQVSILAIEPPEGKPVRISLRSKGQIDVARFAERFGGGGHARAAGLKLDANFDDAVQRIVSAMREQMS